MPTFRHIVLIKWTHPLSDDELDEIQAAIDQLAEEADTVRALWHGPDLVTRPGRHDYALVADFDDVEGWQDYSAHPAHDDLRAILEPVKADTAVAQFFLDDARTHHKPRA
jgi:stress responsive alpha/beta barrel protein